MSNIIKGNFNQPFVTMYNESIQDPKLSAQAKGVHAYLLSLPGDWTVRAKELHKHFKNGRDGIISALNELVSETYVHKIENRDGGKFDGVTYIVYPVRFERAVQLGLVNASGQAVPEQKKLKKETKETIPHKEIIDYLNQKADRSYKHTAKSTQEKIRARWNEGQKLEDFKRVIDNMTSNWKGDPKMDQYLRPETLFGTKFDSYLNTKPKAKAPKHFQDDQAFQVKEESKMVMTEERRLALLADAGII